MCCWLTFLTSFSTFKRLLRKPFNYVTFIIRQNGGLEVAPPYGGQQMDFSTLIELLKLAVAIFKVIVKLVKALRKRKKKPP